MTLPPPNLLERLTHADLIGVVRDLIGEVTRMQAETEKLGGALAKLRVDHQAVKDELARLKHLPPRPPIKPSGMDKSTQAKGPEAGDEKGGRSSRRRGSQLDRLKIGAIIVVKADPPAGSRNKGFEDIVVQDLSLNPQVTRYRRERWETPDGKTIIAALDPGLVGGYGPHLHRLVLTPHFSGQVTCERITALLNGMGVVISKRQVVRLLTAKSNVPRQDEAVLKAGLCGAYVTVDDTGARHAGKNGYTTQIGSYNFTTFRTGPSKSRLAFLSRLCGGVSLYVINDAALAYMEERNLPQIVIGKFKEHKARIFLSAGDWESHLHALGLSAMKVTPDPVLIASEAALWGAIHHQGLLPDTVIVSDDAGQFRVGAHALCWIHAERLVHKLVPANDKQRNAIEIAKRMIWWFYRALKDYKLAPSVQQAQLLRAPFRPYLQTRQHRLCHARQAAQTAVSKQGRAPARSRTPGDTDQYQLFRKRHPRLRHEKKNLRRDHQRQGPRCARHHAGACQNLHEVEIVVLRIHRRPPRHPRAKNPGPRKPHPASPRINPTSLTREFAPVTFPSGQGSDSRSLSQGGGLDRGLMSDAEWACFEPFVTVRGAHSGRPAKRSPACSGRDFLDCPHRRTMAGSARTFRQMVVGLSAVPALDAQRVVGAPSGSPERDRGRRQSVQIVNRPCSGTSLRRQR